MANQDDPNNQNPNQNIINPPNQPMVQINQPFQNRQRGTGFTNISRILGANVGAGQQLAGRIGGAIGGQGQKVRQNLGQAQQQFQTGFQQARQQALANIGAATALTKQPGESDEAYEARIASQSPDYSQIGQNLRSAAYTGPTGFENPNVLFSQAQTAGRLGTFARSGMGQGILARQYGGGRGTYGAGQNILDQMFLSQDPNAQRMLQQARQGVVGLGQEIAGASTQAQQAAGAIQQAVEEEKGKAAQNIASSIGSIQSRGQQAAAQFYADRDRFNQLLTAKKETDEQGNVRYRDASGNLINLTDKDYQIISNPQQFGLQSEEILLDTKVAPAELLQSTLQDIARSGMATNVGTPKYTSEQQEAVKNLQLLLGKTPEAATQFKSDIYGLDPTNIENKSEWYKRMMGVAPEKISQNQETINTARELDTILRTGGYGVVEKLGLVAPLLNKLFPGERFTIENGLEGYIDLARNRVTPLWESKIAENKTLQESIANRTSLQNYLNELYKRSNT